MLQRTKRKRGHSPAPRAHHTKKKGAMNFWYFLTMSPFPFDCRGKIIRQKAEREIECIAHSRPFRSILCPVGRLGILVTRIAVVTTTYWCHIALFTATILRFLTPPSVPAWRPVHRRWPSKQTRRWLPMSLFHRLNCQHRMPRWCIAATQTKTTRGANVNSNNSLAIMSYSSVQILTSNSGTNFNPNW